MLLEYIPKETLADKCWEAFTKMFKVVKIGEKVPIAWRTNK